MNSFFCLSLILKSRLKHSWTVFVVLLDLLCTFGCTLYFHFWEYKVHTKVIFSMGNGKRVHSTSKSTFMYFQMHYELSIVLCTFKCMLKSKRCMLKHCRKLRFNFLKQSMNAKVGMITHLFATRQCLHMPSKIHSCYRSIKLDCFHFFMEISLKSWEVSCHCLAISSQR